MMDDYLITGGAGFIGSNLAHYYLSRGRRVVLLDNFSRAGARENVRWLKEMFGRRVVVVEEDVCRPSRELRRLVEDSQVVFHLAGQVAVTTSVTSPRQDFEVNALGTLNVLEAVRHSTSQPVLLYSSTNKVYGKMSDLEICESAGRYSYAGLRTGVPETRPLDFYSPYGCSKGCGDSYVLDYARIYGLRTIVFRQSCIYGPRQFGIEDQGWVAWFAIRALQNLPVTIYGDGKQVRDVLFVRDLLEAYDLAVENIEWTAGQAYNVGGGGNNTLSLLELIDRLEEIFGRTLPCEFSDWRPGDQQVFISDIRKAERDFGWVPRTSVAEGVGSLVEWLSCHRHLFMLAPAPVAVTVEPAAVR